MATIKNIRLSFIWVDTLPGLLDGGAAAASLAWLGQRGDFIYNFELAQRTGSVVPWAISTPWRGLDSGWSFWRHYFEDKKASAVTGSQAWKKLIPFREELIRFTPEGEAFSELHASAFYFSHGSALVVTLNLRRQAISELEAAKRAMALRHARILALPDAGNQRYTLDILGNQLRERIHETRFEGVAQHAGRNQPFSIVTVLEGDDIDRLATVEDGDDTHRALEAMTSWNPNFDVLDLTQRPIDDSKIKRSNQKGLKNDLVYARKSGLAIWLPRQLNDGAKGRKALSCYHNNMLHGSVQLRSLAELVYFAKHNAAASFAVKQRSKRAATILDRLREGKELTYRSRCLARQVEQTLAEG